MPWGMLTKNCPFFENTFESYFPLDKNDTSNLEPKANPFKTVLIRKEMLQAGSPSMICVVARSRQTMRTKKKTKEKLIVMSCHALEKFN